MNSVNPAEEHMLIAVHNDFETLEFDDGSKWSVEPGDNPTISTWLPTETIRIKLVDDASPWPYELTNIAEGISVRARRK